MLERISNCRNVSVLVASVNIIPVEAVCNDCQASATIILTLSLGKLYSLYFVTGYH